MSATRSCRSFASRLRPQRQTLRGALVPFNPSYGRYISTHNSALGSRVGTHILAGIVGGSIVVGAGYTWYHFSGVKRAVDAAASAKFYLEQARKIVDRKNSTAGPILASLRQAAKAYVSILPGAGILVDRAFDSVDDVVDSHSEEVNRIVRITYQEIQDIVQANGGKSSTTTALQVMAVLQKRTAQLHRLGLKVGGDVLSPLGDKFPEVKRKMSEGLWKLQSLALSDKGPDAKKMLEDTQQQVKQLLSQSTSSETVEKARSLVNEKLAKLRRKEGEDK